MEYQDFYAQLYTVQYTAVSRLKKEIAAEEAWLSEQSSTITCGTVGINA